MIQIIFEGVMCFVDLEKEEIYSAKLKKLKPQRMKEHNNEYYMIKFQGNKRYKSKLWLLAKAMEVKNEKNVNS